LLLERRSSWLDGNYHLEIIAPRGRLARSWSPWEASMSFDAYTKGVVTVIAAALCALVVQNAIQQSRAENGQLQKVQICDDQHCLHLKAIGKYSSDKGYFSTFGLPVSSETDDH
jgi:hypothetical protein